MSIKTVKCCIVCGSEEMPPEDSLCVKCKNPGKISSAPLKKANKELNPFAPFIAIDVETSGLPEDGECDLLEIAAVYGDYGQGPKSRLELNFYIQHDEIRWQPGAKKAVGHLEAKIKKADLPVLSREDAIAHFNIFLKACQERSGEWKNVLVARNLHTLVIPMLKSYGLYNQDLIDHRSLDLSSAFYFAMGGPSTLKDILRKFSVEAPDNSCLSDALGIMSIMYEEVGRQTKQSTVNWY